VSSLSQAGGIKFIMPTNFNSNEAITYSVALVIIGLVILLGLWLPDFLHKD